MPRKQTKEPERVVRDGWQYVEWYDADKKRVLRRSLGTKDPVEGLRRFAEYVLRGETSRPRRDDGLTVRKMLEDYYRQHVTALDDKGRTRVVDTTRIAIIIRHLTTFFGDRLVRDIGPLDCRAYLLARRQNEITEGRLRQSKKGASDATIYRELTCMQAAVNHAVRWKTLDRSDYPHLEFPRLEDDNKVKWFTKEELVRIIEAAVVEDTDLASFIKIAYFTGARRASIELLTRGQVDLAAGFIDLQMPGGRVTKKRRPRVPIFPEIRRVVESLVAPLKEPGDRLFGDANFYVPFVDLCDALAAAGKISRSGHPHMLRHSRASHMLQDGEDIWKVARLLGDTVKTVERTYAHALPEHLTTHSTLPISSARFAG